MPLTDTLIAEPAPLKVDEGGAMRVGSTRVSLESVIAAFENGCGAEAIVLMYPTLSLTDVYGVIAYYLWNRDEVDAYLSEREESAVSTRRAMEVRFPPDGIRERLLSRRRAAQ
jgi:uncharacterized protein (DUF433 family)